MGVQLNIKDAETVARIRAIADRRGMSVTATIRALAEEEDARVTARVETLLAELHAINPDPRALLAPEWRDKDSVAICNSIYNEDGSFAA